MISFFQAVAHCLAGLAASTPDGRNPIEYVVLDNQKLHRRLLNRRGTLGACFDTVSLPCDFRNLRLNRGFGGNTPVKFVTS